MKITDEATIKHLSYLSRTYEAVTGTIAETRQRLIHINPDMDAEQNDIVKGLESIKGKLSRQIERQLRYWPIWTEWLKKVPGIGPAIGASLIRLYYYRSVPICKACGADMIKVEDGFQCSKTGDSAKGNGVLQYRIELKNFETVSKWWHYMGVHCDDTGRKPKLKAKTKSDWSTKGRAIAFQIGEQFIKHKGAYREFFDARKAKREKTHPDATKMHRNNMARHETAKLFLSHFIAVAKHLDGEPFTEPYAGVILGHTNISKPFYFEPDVPEACEVEVEAA